MKRKLTCPSTYGKEDGNGKLVAAAAVAAREKKQVHILTRWWRHVTRERPGNQRLIEREREREGGGVRGWGPSCEAPIENDACIL